MDDLGVSLFLEFSIWEFGWSFIIALYPISTSFDLAVAGATPAYVELVSSQRHQVPYGAP